MSGHISGVQRLLLKNYPFAYFFHCAAHRLILVLCQSASSIPAVKVFFALTMQSCFSEVFKLLLLNATIAITSSSVERSFSCLKRIKIYLRNRMVQDHLGCLCRISVHKDIL